MLRAPPSSTPTRVGARAVRLPGLRRSRPRQTRWPCRPSCPPANSTRPRRRPSPGVTAQRRCRARSRRRRRAAPGEETTGARSRDDAPKSGVSPGPLLCIGHHLGPLESLPGRGRDPARFGGVRLESHRPSLRTGGHCGARSPRSGETASGVAEIALGGPEDARTILVGALIGARPLDEFIVGFREGGLNL
jgi:hypothetical protein